MILLEIAADILITIPVFVIVAVSTTPTLIMGGLFAPVMPMAQLEHIALQAPFTAVAMSRFIHETLEGLDNDIVAAFLAGANS